MIIGGIAAEIHDLPVPATVDIDVTPARDRKNLERLARAFDELDAGLYTAEDAGTWFPRTPVELWSQYDTLHLTTKAGPVDIVFTPDGAPSGYADLAVDAVSAELAHQPVMVITVAKWEALKQATGRAKDLEHLDRSAGVDGQALAPQLRRRAPRKPATRRFTRLRRAGSLGANTRVGGLNYFALRNCSTAECALR